MSDDGFLQLARDRYRFAQQAKNALEVWPVDPHAPAVAWDDQWMSADRTIAYIREHYYQPNGAPAGVWQKKRDA